MLSLGVFGGQDKSRDFRRVDIQNPSGPVSRGLYFAMLAKTKTRRQKNRKTYQIVDPTFVKRLVVFAQDQLLRNVGSQDIVGESIICKIPAVSNTHMIERGINTSYSLYDKNEICSVDALAIAYSSLAYGMLAASVKRLT